MNASDFPHLEGVILLACLRGLFVGCFLWVMPQVFLALQCFACNAFQVQQEKKGKKWRCKLCGEGQSFRKIFFRGTSESSLCVLLLHDVHTHIQHTPQTVVTRALLSFKLVYFCLKRQGVPRPCSRTQHEAG